jgi:hypothetical protein
MRAAAGIVAVATLVAVGQADAQEALRAQCTSGGATVPFCELAVLGLENLAARAGIVSAGGNPVPGTASTFGMRLGPLPRMSLAARFTVMPVELPPIFVRGQDETPDGLASSINLDASVGLFTGFSVAPTVGGLLSVDLLGNLSFLDMPGGEGFNDDNPVAWAVGARVGITRESFTAPGISVSGMYRRITELRYGDSSMSRADALIQIDGHRVWNVRAAISKRLALAALTGGIGYDHHSGAAFVRVAEVEGREDGFSVGRFNGFVSGGATFLILTIAGDLGWQQGADAPAGLAGADVAGKSGFFGSVAIRLAI